jgi:amino acid adenylation domain-containing protein
MRANQNFPSNGASDRPADFVALVQMHSRIRPESLAFVFLEDGEREGPRLTFGDLDRRARAIAAHLQRCATRNARALLLFPPGLDYIEAFFGCLYAGVIAVPAYPPTGRHLQRLRSILADAEPSLILTTQALRSRLSEENTDAPNVLCCATDVLDTGLAGEWRPPSIAPDEIAFLQYTSGSTGDPRGVMVSHGNLIANEALIAESFHHDERSTLVGWLPLYHDMGLIGNILQPLYVGATSYLMSPMVFLEKPARWLAAISKYRAHTSGGPNFGFELCVRKISDDDKKGLDLSSWRIAFSGAEPVRAATLDRFAHAFAGCGFHKQSFYPCYGLAEATLVLSAPSGVRETPVRTLDKGALEQNFAVTALDKGVETVGCGRVWAAHDIRIVDPITRRECPDSRVGEIWVSGPSVAKGYWRRDAQTEDVFRARLAGDDTRAFLRTGDLGFLDDGELYIAGRLKDLIIIAGRNYYPHDIEGVIEDAVEGLRPGSVTAVHMTDGDAEFYIVFAEPRRTDIAELRRNGGRELIQSVRAALAEAIDVAPRDIILLKPGATPKTSSGKTRRAECRRTYLAGEFDVLARGSDAVVSHAEPTPSVGRDAEPLLRLALAQLTPEQRAPLLTRLLAAEAARLLRVPERTIDIDAPISHSGLDSLKAIELRHGIEQALGVAPPLNLLLSEATFSQAAQAISRLEEERTAQVDTADQRLSYSQQAMWTVQQLDADSVIFNMRLALDIGAIDAAEFARALDQTITANGELRTLYRATGERVQAVEVARGALLPALEIVDAQDWDEGALQADLAARVAEPFDLEARPPLRVTLYRRNETQTALFVAHHIAVDFWSLLLFVMELDARFRNVEHAAPRARYTAFAARQHAYLETSRAEADWRYWREELSGELPTLQLPQDFKSRGAPSFAGASRTIRLEATLTAALEALAQREGVTLFSALLAAYFVLLHRHSGQRDIIVGAPTNGRLDAEFARTIGNFVNPVAIRSTIEPFEKARDVMHRIHKKVRGALAHQEFPFPIIVERLRPTRDQNSWPIYQTIFVLQQTQSDAPPQFSVLASDQGVTELDIFGVKGRIRDIPQRVESFEMNVMAVKDHDELVISFQYPTQSFADGTVERFARHYANLLSGIVDNPDARVGDLSLLDEDEGRRLIDTWNETSKMARENGVLLHTAFERWASADPDAIAIVYEQERLSYAELNARANQLAHYLRQHHDLRPDDVVAVCAERSIDLFVALLAVLKAGGAYLPIDTELPSERIALTLGEAKPRLVLTQQQLRTALEAAVAQIPVVGDVAKAPISIFALDSQRPLLASSPQCDLHTATKSGNLAYVIYTSGSTGVPKGVMISHGGAVSSTRARDQFYADKVSNFLLLSPVYFDSSVAGIFWTLSQGGTLTIPTEEERRDARALGRIVSASQISHLLCLPSLYDLLLDFADPAQFKALRCCIVAGEACAPEVAHKHFRALPELALVNEYGPTECSVWSVAHKVAEGERSETVVIGRPVPGVQTVLLSNGGALTPLGAIGEICIGGAGLGRGYLNRPDLTAERFIPNPFDGSGERLYRTGDLGRYQKDGNIEFLGRMDQQVKIRGFRIEPGEIESVLHDIDGVTGAIVVARDDVNNNLRLVGYATLSSGRALSQAEIREALALKLPDYMIPGAIVLLDAFPLNPNGKVDRKALPAPTLKDLRQEEFVAPRTEMQMRLAGAWETILGWDQVGLDDNFFEIGGDSIRAIQIANLLYRTGVRLTPRQIFQYPTIVALAASLEGADADRQGESASNENKCDAPFELAEIEGRELAEILAEHRDAQDIYRLTPLQEGILLHSLAREGVGVYHLQDQYQFNGPLDADAFFDAWRSVVARHDTLRTSFHLDSAGRPYQLVHSRVQLDCRFHDLTAFTRNEQAAEIDRYLKRALERGFDLSQAPLLRIHLMRLASDRHMCIREFHHIILDDWCTSPLMLDVRSHYAAAATHAPLELAPAPRFRDYIAWLRRQDVQAAQAYWTRYLAGFTEPTPLVIAKAGEATAAATVDDVFEETSREDFSRLKELAREHRLTINTFVQAAVGLLLCRYASAQEAVFGVTVAGRPTDLPQCESTLGLFINSLPLRVRVSPAARVLDWLKALLADNIEMRQHEFVSQSLIQQWSEIPRADALLFQHLLTFENAPIDQSLVNDRDIFDISLAELRVHTNYPITFVAIPGETLALRITYDRDRFDGAEMRRMIRHWRLLVSELLRNADGILADLAPLDSAEQHEIIVERNKTEKDYGAPRDLVARFEAQAATNGDAIAANCRGETLTFGELNERANCLAHALIEQGFGCDDVIAVFEERGLDFLTSMLGIFKCGAGYLPIDPAHPDGRIASVLGEAHVAAILAGPAHFQRSVRLTPKDGTHMSRILDRSALEAVARRFDNPTRRHAPSSIAFVIYTSGSTGKPKGAMVEHRGMFNNLITKVPALGLTSSDVVAQTASQCFDISVWQFLVGLAIGARVEILPDEISRDPERLVEAIPRCGITVLESVPSMIRALLDTVAEQSLDRLRWLIPCGEAFTPELCRRVMAQHPSVRLLNAYGPAECSDDVTYYPIARAPSGTELSTPIGHPVDNCRIYVLDRWLDPTPIGARGEICVGGVQVGRGYLHRPDLTANAFRPNPFGPPGSRLYRTGDLGRWRADGVLDFLGRVDHQVKIRGHRIEPGEIEACLVTHPEIEEACVVPRAIGRGVYQLVAYVVGAERDPSALRDYLAQTLPDFMLPSFIVFLDAMPLSPNDKIDRRRLPAPDVDAQRDSQKIAPRTPTEEALYDIWAGLLGVRSFGVTDNFFELGGHSLLAIQLRSRIQSAFDVEIELKNLFNTTSVESLAREIEERILADIDAMSDAQAERLSVQYAE